MKPYLNLSVWGLCFLFLNACARTDALVRVEEFAATFVSIKTPAVKKTVGMLRPCMRHCILETAKESKTRGALPMDLKKQHYCIQVFNQF